MKIRVYKVRGWARLPARAYETDAGMDLFFYPDDNALKSIRPNQSVLLHTGLKIEVPEGYMLEIKNKSGIASKRNLVVGACVVDSGYNGEIFVNLHNIGLLTEYVEPGQKIAQAVMVPIVYPELEEISEDNVYGRKTDRGFGTLGSTGDQ
jgi:dUTP pyrophosphatase